ncbi:hypothetical protein [Pedobacter suwonensis]|uniref:hypothetical protein n=1 Tax=Pedobacter suwonensis TaxID=332999 RepID=UPI0036B8AB13
MKRGHPTPVYPYRDVLLKNIRKISDDSFILKDGDKIYRLSPFYSVTSTAYGVYATIRNF